MTLVSAVVRSSGSLQGPGARDIVGVGDDRAFIFPPPGLGPCET